MKKALSLALCGALIFSLAGCGGKQAAGEQTPATSETPVVSEQAEETKSPAQETVQSSETIEEISAETVVNLTLDELTEDQIWLFKATAESFVTDVLDGTMTIEEMNDRQNLIIDG